MRPTLLLAIFGAFALAAPLAYPDESHAVVARDEGVVAIRDAEAEPVSVDDRQLSPGGLGNIDWNGVIDRVQRALQDSTSLTTAQIKTIVGIVTDISKGQGLNGNVVSKLLTIPSSVLVRLPSILAPILLPAVTGLPGVNVLVYQLLALLQTLGGGLGLVGGLTGGLGGLLGGRSLSEISEVAARALSGVNVDDVLVKLTGALKSTGISEGDQNVVGGLVRTLLTGGTLGSGALSQLQSLPTNALSRVIGALNTVIWQAPAIGPLVGPLLVLLQLLILSGGGGGLVGGLLGGVNNAAGGILGGKPAPIGGLLGGII